MCFVEYGVTLECKQRTNILVLSILFFFGGKWKYYNIALCLAVTSVYRLSEFYSVTQS